MTVSILDQYAAILLDMNGTFMFNENRFGDAEDFFATYSALGGVRLDRNTVNTAIRNCYEGMLKDYENELKIDDFPSVTESLMRYAAVAYDDVHLLEAVFTHHEKGFVPAEFATCLRKLSESHRLGIVSNIWAKKESWLLEFEHSDIREIWDSMVFSSDSRSIKPSPALFRQAIVDFALPVSKMVFIGDSLRADIIPAKSFGMDTIWICSGERTHLYADYVISSLLQLTDQQN